MIRFTVILIICIFKVSFAESKTSDFFVFEGALSTENTKEIYSAICMYIDSKPVCNLTRMSMGNSSSLFSKCAVSHTEVLNWNKAIKSGNEWVSTKTAMLDCKYEYTYRMSKNGMIITRNLSKESESKSYCDKIPLTEKLKYHENYQGIEFNIDGCKSIKMGT